MSRLGRKIRIGGKQRETVWAIEIGIIVRSPSELRRGRLVVKQAGAESCDLDDGIEPESDRIAVGIMHLAKGLEFGAWP